MASKRRGSKARPGAAAKIRKGTATKGRLRDLEMKDGQKIRGGKWSRDNGSVSSSTSSS